MFYKCKHDGDHDTGNRASTISLKACAYLLTLSSAFSLPPDKGAVTSLPAPPASPLTRFTEKTSRWPLQTGQKAMSASTKKRPCGTARCAYHDLRARSLPALS